MQLVIYGITYFLQVGSTPNTMALGAKTTYDVAGTSLSL
jgi:hypothetical protein